MEQVIETHLLRSNEVYEVERGHHSGWCRNLGCECKVFKSAKPASSATGTSTPTNATFNVAAPEALVLERVRCANCGRAYEGRFGTLPTKCESCGSLL